MKWNRAIATLLHTLVLHGWLFICTSILGAAMSLSVCLVATVRNVAVDLPDAYAVKSD